MKPVSAAAILVPCLLLFGCASSDSGNGDDASGGDGDGGPPIGDGGSVDAGAVAACPDGQFAVGVSATGELTCTSIDVATATAVRSRCSVYAGVRDSCGACADAPAKWSQSGPLGCSVGEGAGNACVTTTLDDPTTLATLDLDGNVNDDDKLYASMHCIAAPRAPRPAPCAPEWAISGRIGSTWQCSPISEAAIAYVGERCNVHLGWRDSCDGCTTAPAKWGFANDTTCANGAGLGNTCTMATLGGEAVNLFGLDLDGDIDGNDKLYIGLSCAAPAPSATTATTQCPAGQFVTGTNADGSFSCSDPATVFSAYVRDRCALLFGWRDSCDACTEPPIKWGRVSTTSCANGAGADNTCADTVLGENTVPLFGLSTDGDVNGDDTLYVGFRCAP